MTPVVALIGRSNVGKSTLFNLITRTKDAIVADFSGLTIDRKYGETEIKGTKFIFIDTAGINCTDCFLKSYSNSQSLLAIKEADIIFFIVDAKTGLMQIDKDITSYLRSNSKKTYLIINKTDGIDINEIISDFSYLGFSEEYFIVLHNNSIIRSIEQCLLTFLKLEKRKKTLKSKSEITTIKYEKDNIKHSFIKLAIVGRPNVGKSTLINCILKKERVVVSDVPGTTRDSIYISTEYDSKKYILIDTAGVRKRSKVTKSIEKFSIVKTLDAIKNSNVVLLLIDAAEGVSNQDLLLLNFILNSGRSLVIAINKFDSINFINRKHFKDNLKLHLNFINFVRIHFISALHGKGLKNLFMSIQEAYRSSIRSFDTSLLTRIMKTAEEKQQLPFINGKRAKMKYAHLGGCNPPIVVIHGNKLSILPNNYKRYLKNYFIHALNIFGTPIILKFKDSKNPYLDKNIVLKQHKY
ncbi:GTPase Der [Candidatus Providencia siddallii]|uniref:GTPase Der n=1 Tax=Candidatus Providencia siddallii TaxID=1715285 RepID=A0A0M6W810_9GAMM|nr:GTPase Der [Candidatus Providencia siddallii]